MIMADMPNIQHTLSFPMRVNAWRPRWRDIDALFRNAVEAPMPSNAACNFRAKSETGTLRDTGKTATVLRLVLLRPSSDTGLLPWALDDESTSSLTRDAIVFNNLCMR